MSLQSNAVGKKFHMHPNIGTRPNTPTTMALYAKSSSCIKAEKN